MTKTAARSVVMEPRTLSTASLKSGLWTHYHSVCSTWLICQLLKGSGHMCPRTVLVLAVPNVALSELGGKWVLRSPQPHSETALTHVFEWPVSGLGLPAGGAHLPHLFPSLHYPCSLQFRNFLVAGTGQVVEIRRKQTTHSLRLWAGYSLSGMRRWRPRGRDPGRVPMDQSARALTRGIRESLLRNEFTLRPGR